ncbi:hypothetical protein NDU88_002503 [Pleurodeles waltl]|uniref:Uncharacterized protein n=1 Tax=Pleurodeles waltl TaxID=8319 RepID=A0AAV7UWD0_PLEWA|nr:hypothetical protein NDU88_002503 [Pleurodeles waltl]
MKGFPLQEKQGRVGPIKGGAAQQEACGQPPGVQQVKLFRKKDMEKRTDRKVEEPSRDRRGVAAPQAMDKGETDKDSHTHHCEDEDTRAKTGEVMEAWCEDWWTPPVEALKPATTLESCGKGSEWAALFSASSPPLIEEGNETKHGNTRGFVMLIPSMYET